MAGDENGKPYLEQHLDSTARQFTNPIMMTGDAEWGDYTVEVKVKPLSLAGMAGVVFRYHTNRHYYLFGLAGGNQVQLALHLPIEPALRVPAWKELGTADFRLRHHALLRAQGREPRAARIRAYVDGKLVLEATDRGIAEGQGGRHRGRPGAIPGVPRDWRPTQRRARSPTGSVRAMRNWRDCATRIRSRSCGRNSIRRSSAPAAMSASATWMATACRTC